MRTTIVLLIVLILALLFLGGCNEERKVWGQGDPTAEWRGYFGNGNLSRLNFVQTEMMNKQRALIFGLDAKDPDGKPVRKRGFIERITTLEGLAERVKKMEEAEEQEFIIIGGNSEDTDPSGHSSGRCLVDHSIDIGSTKPYIYTDDYKDSSGFGGPTNTVCTKHGRLQWAEKWVFLDTGKSYCSKCVYEVAMLYFDRHIGVDPNEVAEK